LVVSFANIEIRRICEDEHYAISILGQQATIFLLSRLADLEAANNIGEIIVGKPGEIELDKERCYKIDLINDIKLIICNNDLSAELGFDWKNIRRVKIIKIDSYEF